ncbi:MAG TPA: quinone oxidoreductase [Ktedonobacterales bacterium]|nr:quinone oxidoreductase [Ktedonobacterales bacterium]
MKAIRVHEHGGPEVPRLDDIPLPEAGAGQVRIKLEAAGVNFIDIYARTGQYQRQLPLVLGSEGAGVVDAVGPGVTDLHLGDRVASAQLAGAYAEYAIAPAAQVVPVPEGVETAVAAAVLLQGLTAHYLTHSTYPLRAGETALVHAAAGGVGALLVQMAKRRGARVIATVGSEEKARVARASGADEVILYTQSDFAAETRRLTDGAGVQVVYDSVGLTTFDQSMNCLRPRGYLVLFGQSSGAVPPFDPQLLNAKGSLFLTRPTLGHYIADRQELLWRVEDLFAWIRAGELTVRIDRTYPLAEAGAAQTALASRATRGKVLLLL